MQTPRVSVRLAVRAAGFAAAAAIGVTALLHAARHEPSPSPDGAHSAIAVDSVASELMRCQTIGMAAQDDQKCLAAWAENRRRFFGAEHTANVHTSSTDGKPPQQSDR